MTLTLREWRDGGFYAIAQYCEWIPVHSDAGMVAAFIPRGVVDESHFMNTCKVEHNHISYRVREWELCFETIRLSLLRLTDDELLDWAKQLAQ